jgi:hypothetical protein
MKLSRQRLWQINKHSQGLCTICGREKIFKFQRCENCYGKRVKQVRQYYKKNKARIKKYLVKWKKKNRAYCNEYHRQYRQRKKNERIYAE